MSQGSRRVSGPPTPPTWVRSLEDLPSRVGADDLNVFRPPADAVLRRCGVLLLFGDGPDGPDVLLTERSTTLRAHAGQVSFPGGAVEDVDDGPVSAAVREAVEETGLGPAGVRILGTLPAVYVPASGNLVTPVLAWWADPSPVRAVDPAEVARVARVPVAELVDPAHRFAVRHPLGFVGPGFRVRGLFVWGFTAGLLDHVLHLTGWDTPWDRSRVEELPGYAAASPPRPPEADSW